MSAPQAAPDDEDSAAYIVRQLGVRNVQEINTLLIEGLFFYRKDNDLLFAKLSERQSAFKAFWRRYFGIDLAVEENVAYRRIITDGEELDAGFRNPNLSLGQRDIFQWGGPGRRERSLVFLLFLQFYESDIRRREEQAYGERLFFLHEFYRFTQDEYTKWFTGRTEEKPSDHTVFQSVREVFDTLERFRFIERGTSEEITAKDRALLPRGYDADRVIIYRALDGLRAYDPHTLNETIALDAYKTSTTEGDAPGTE